MPLGSDQMPGVRSPQWELNRRAIDVACQLLLGGIWLECQIKNVPRLRARLVEGSHRLGRPVHEFRKSVLQVSQPGNEEA
jgi:hypothetical protein